MKILNFGSLNLDYTYRVPHIVAPGETITSGGLEIYPGGKGLNQSVALAKAGAEVYHAGQIGEDGSMLKQVCGTSGVDTRFIRTSEVRSGNAIIQLDDSGQNCIILFPGANRAIEKEFVDEVLAHFNAGDCLLLQNEISNLPYIIERASRAGLEIILNPSPMDDRLLSCDMTKVSMFILNEVEGAQLTGKTETEEILSKMRDLYPEAEIVLTLGSEGSVYCGKEETIRQGIVPTKAEDTTGAGDTFTGFFIAEYFGHRDPKKALETASMAASIAVSRKGAASSIPDMEEVQKRMESVSCEEKH